MNVVEMDSLLESIRIVWRNNRVLCIEQVPFPIALEDLAKDPTVPVKVGELRSLELIVEFRGAGLLQKVRFRPQTAQARSFGIAVKFSLLLSLRRIVLSRRVHFGAISFVVPPDYTEVRRNHVVALMHVTVHALLCRNAASQLIFDGMA